MPIIIRNPNPSQIDEYVMLEIQGDLQSRTDDVKDCSGKFVGDVLYNKYGKPILIIGHHILFGTEKKLSKPFAVIEKVEKACNSNSQTNQSFSILETTLNIENRTKAKVEYHVRALIKKKLVFTQRPRPIITSV